MPQGAGAAQQVGWVCRTTGQLHRDVCCVSRPQQSTVSCIVCLRPHSRCRPAVVLLNHYGWLRCGQPLTHLANYACSAENEFNVIGELSRRACSAAPTWLLDCEACSPYSALLLRSMLPICPLRPACLTLAAHRAVLWPALPVHPRRCLPLDGSERHGVPRHVPCQLGAHAPAWLGGVWA